MVERHSNGLLRGRADYFANPSLKLSTNKAQS
jgi:hypothetical protein